MHAEVLVWDLHFLDNKHPDGAPTLYTLAHSFKPHSSSHLAHTLSFLYRSTAVYLVSYARHTPCINFASSLITGHIPPVGAHPLLEVIWFHTCSFHGLIGLHYPFPLRSSPLGPALDCFVLIVVQVVIFALSGARARPCHQGRTARENCCAVKN